MYYRKLFVAILHGLWKYIFSTLLCGHYFFNLFHDFLDFGCQMDLKMCETFVGKCIQIRPCRPKSPKGPNMDPQGPEIMPECSPRVPK